MFKVDIPCSWGHFDMCLTSVILSIKSYDYSKKVIHLETFLRLQAGPPHQGLRTSPLNILLERLMVKMESAFPPFRSLTLSADQPFKINSSSINPEYDKSGEIDSLKSQ